METQDPDDVFTLAILATHPEVDLLGVTVVPGGRDQVGLVKHVLARLGRGEVPVGGNPLRATPAVSGFHHKWLGTHDAPVDLLAEEVLFATAAQGATLLTGGPLLNFAKKASEHTRWVAQGGFAGDSVVPPEHRLEKFAGRETCPTFNFAGSPTGALNLLGGTRERLLVSKNVCHGVAWDRAFHDRVGALPRRSAGLDLVYEGMTAYLAKKPEGKKLHDPLAMTVAIDPSVCTFARVEVYRERGEWGSRLTTTGTTQISVAVDHERFFEVLARVG